PLVYHPEYSAPMASTHRFPMAKFRLLKNLLLRDGAMVESQFFCPELTPWDWIERIHTPDYVDAYRFGTLDANAQRRIGLPWSEAIARRTRIAVGGTVLTARLALENGLCCNLAGGTHHAFPEYGSGFCIFNDIAVTARLLLDEGAVQKILIVDLDVHQGDGTAWIFQDEPRVFTFSMHCGANFPLRKQTSDLDVPLEIGMEDEVYLRTLDSYLEDLLSQVKPDLVLYDAGVDPHRGDRLGKLAMTDTGLFQREMQVLGTCVGAGYPVGCVIGGGYSTNMDTLVHRHSLIHRAAAQVWRLHRL
ncbi:MAG: histone deacetylase, partial [Cyanobacteria bacterium P01_F01_bin.153]